MWLDWRMLFNDLDHYAFANGYRDADASSSPTGKPMTDEQVLWYCLIYGTTYQTEMAWTIYYQFPNFEKINLKELTEWNLATLARQRYAKDTKYNKGRIVEQVESMQKLISPYGSIRQWVNKNTLKDGESNFEQMYAEANKIHKYGRMTSWLFCQSLFETAGINVRPRTMLATDPSNWSVRSGLCYLYNREDLIEAKSDKKLSKDDLYDISVMEHDVYQAAWNYICGKNKPMFSNFLLESHLCQYKKLMLGGDYAGHSSGDHWSRGSWLAERWNKEVNYDAFFHDAIPKHHPLVQRKIESKALRDLCMKTGQLINMHGEYPELPNMYLEIGLDPDWFFEKEKYEAVSKRLIDEYAAKQFGYPKIQMGIDNFT